jgi:cytochrome c5
MRTMGVAAAVVVVTFASGFALAAGSATKGRFHFKKSCKSCHVKGGEGGEVTPLSKTQEQWKRYFAKGVHNKGTQKLTDILPAELLKDVERFLVDHAADSPQPETCG